MKTQKENNESVFYQIKNKSFLLIGNLIILSLISILMFSSCKKRKEIPEEEDTEQTTANDNNMAENYMSDIETMGAQVSETGNISYRSSSENGLKLDLSPGATVTVVGKIITIDFGAVGCLGNDGRTRTGKLIYDYSGSVPSSAIYYRNPGFKVNITSQNYVVDNYSVTINNKTISNTSPLNLPLGLNPGTNLTWLINASISISKPNNGGSISWNCSRTKELVNTNDTNCYKGQSKHIAWNKAIVKLNGSTTGTNAKNEQFTATATNLVRDFSCTPDQSRPMRHPFISGTISYSPANRPTRLVDFGNGTCDLNATVTINSKVFTITLP